MNSNIIDYTNNIEPTNTLKSYTQKNLSENYCENCSDGVDNLILNSNLSDNNSIQ